jgi:hypothetical protein
MSGPFWKAWARYNAALEKNPVGVKALTSLTGFTLGDIIAQVTAVGLRLRPHLSGSDTLALVVQEFLTTGDEPKKGYDYMRTLRLGEDQA